DRRRDAELLAELDDLAAEPGQLQPVAALEIERHRCLHGWWHVAGEFADALDRVGRQRYCFGARDSDGFPPGSLENHTYIRIVPQLSDRLARRRRDAGVGAEQDELHP